MAVASDHETYTPGENTADTASLERSEEGGLGAQSYPL